MKIGSFSPDHQHQQLSVRQSKIPNSIKNRPLRIRAVTLSNSFSDAYIRAREKAVRHRRALASKNKEGSSVLSSNLVSITSRRAKLRAARSERYIHIVLSLSLFLSISPPPAVSFSIEGSYPRTIYQFTMIKSKHGK